MQPNLIQTTPLSSPTVQTVDAMIGEVAALIGGDEDPDARARAINFLDRAIDHMNMNGIVMFRRTEETYSTITDGQQTLTQPSAWGWPADRAFVYDSANRLINVMEWRPWEVFRGFIGDTDTTDYSVPLYLSIKTEVNESLIYMWPFAKASRVSKIILPYFQRIQRISEVGTLTISNEVREGLIMYAEYLMMRYRYKDKPGIWRPFKEDGDEAMRRAKAAAQRSESGWHMIATPDETGRLGDPTRPFPFGTVYLVLTGA